MNLRGLVSVSGKPGLFKLIGQNKTGFILESLDEQKTKTIVNMSTTKLASLEDITVFGETTDLKLMDILEKMKTLKAIPDPKTADGNALRTFFKEVAPQHDAERVYSSDMKKIINWFNLIKDLPLFTEAAPAPLDETAPKETKEAVKKPEPRPIAEKKKPTKTATSNNSTKRLSQKSK